MRTRCTLPVAASLCLLVAACDGGTDPKDVGVDTDTDTVETDVKAGPVDDAYTVTPGRLFQASAAEGLFANDVAIGALSGFEAESEQGATVSVQDDGSFTYQAPATMEGADTFAYFTETPSGFVETGTVTLTPRPGCGDGVKQAGEICYPLRSGFVLGDAPRIERADLNGDGRHDVVVASMLGNDELALQVFRSLGDEMQDGVVVRIAEPAVDAPVAFGDFDGDGHMDAVTVTRSGVVTLKGDGTGGLAVWKHTDIDSYLEFATLAVGPLTAGGPLRVILGATYEDEVRVLSIGADGSATSAQAVVSVAEPERMVMLDYDNDGDLDVVLLSPHAIASGVLLVENDEGTLIDGVVDLAVSTDGVGALLSFDATGDGRPDLVVTSGTSELEQDTLTVFPGRDAVGYGAGVDRTPSGATFRTNLQAGDVNDDGVMDLVGTMPSQGGVTAWFGASDGSFVVGPTTMGGGFEPSIVPAAWDTGTREAIIAVSAGGVRVLRIDGDAWRVRPSRTASIEFGSYLLDGAAGDINDDGSLDLVFTDYTTGKLWALRGTGSGGLRDPLDLGTAAAGVQSCVVADLNDDGVDDIATANTTSSSMSLWFGDGSGGQVAQPDVAVGPGPARVVAVDLNGDDRRDLVTANVGEIGGVNGGVQDSVSVRLALVGGGYGPAGQSEVLACDDPERLVSGDVNGDMKADVVAVCLGDDRVAVLLGDGLGGFEHAAGSPFFQGQGREVALADLNGDTHLDMVVSGSNEGVLRAWLGAGDGTFTASDSVYSGANSYSLALADIDGDDTIDALVTNASGLALWLGAGDGTFKASPVYLDASGDEVLTVDLQADGVPEIVTVGQGGVTVLRAVH